MPAVSDIELISRAMRYAAASAAKTNADVVEQLQSEGSSSLVNSLRTMTMALTIAATGGLSIFEATLQQLCGWQDAFQDADKELKARGYDNLAQRFQDYRDAINVLKHGKGRSYDRLVARHDKLPFRIKLPNEDYFDEGDVSEVTRLIEVDQSFVLGCADIIDEVKEALGL